MKIIANKQLANLSETVKKGDILTVSDNTLIDQNGEVVLFESYREYEGSYEVSRCHHHGCCDCGGEEVDICGTEVLYTEVTDYEDIDLVELKNALKFCTVIDDTKVA